MLKKIVSILLFGSLSLLAQESLQSKIQRLQSVSKAERFQLMNEIKRELVTLHGDQRREALGRLRKHMGRGHGRGKHDGSGRRLHQGQGKNQNKNQQLQKYKNQQHQQQNEQERKNQQKKQQPQHGKKN